MSVEIHVSGPIFDAARRRGIVGEFCEEAVRDVGAQLLADWSTNLNASIRHPTPYYETQTHMLVSGPTAIVNDRGIVYGPWLEGTSSRNRTTRFRGYASLRRARAGLEAKIPRLVRGAYDRLVARL